MKPAVTGVLSLLWMVLGYFGLLQLTRRFFTGRYRAETVAAAIVLAFTIGVNWPRPGSAVEVPSQTLVPTPAAATAGVDVGAACASAHLTGSAGKGNLDAAVIRSGGATAPVTPGAELHAGDVLVARGWAANLELKGPAISVCATVDGKIVPGVRVLYGGSRPDVAAAYNTDALAPTAYEISLPAAQIGPGHHRVQAAAVGADESAAFLPGAIQLVGPPPARGS